MRNCKNCNQALNAVDNFCPNCGQKNIPKLDVKFLLGELFQTIFNLDSKVFRSLKYLIFKPGYLSKEYVGGKRVSYLAPIRIYLVLSFLFFFLYAAFDFDNSSNDSGEKFSVTLNDGKFEINNNSVVSTEVEGVSFTVGGEEVMVPVEELKQMKYDGKLEEGLDSLTAEMPRLPAYFSKKLAVAKLDNKGFGDVMRDQLSLFLILFLPFFALLYSMVFSGSKKGFVANLIFNLHFNSFIILILLFDLLLEPLLNRSEVFNFIWGTILIVYSQYYIVKAVMVFYQRKWWVGLYKYFVLLFGYALLALLFLGAVVISSIVMV